MAEYNRFVAGDPVTLSLVATGESNIGGSMQKPTFSLNLSAIQYNGTTPESSLDSVGMIELPYTAMSNAMNTTASIELVTADDSY